MRPDAPQQEVAEYYRSMLEADGAIPVFSPFDLLDVANLDYYNGADFFFGRAPHRTFASFSPFPEDALADLASEGGLPFRTSPAVFEPHGTPTGEHAHSPRPAGSRQQARRDRPLALPEGNGLVSMMFGPRASPGGRSEDDLIAEQLAEVHAVEAALAESRAAAEQQGNAELEAALALSADSASTQLSYQHFSCAPQSACQEAGIDIPFETPKSLLNDAPPAAPSQHRRCRLRGRV